MRLASIDFQSIALTARPQCLCVVLRGVIKLFKHQRSAKPPAPQQPYGRMVSVRQAEATVRSTAVHTRLTQLYAPNIVSVDQRLALICCTLYVQVLLHNQSVRLYTARKRRGHACLPLHCTPVHPDPRQRGQRTTVEKSGEGCVSDETFACCDFYLTWCVTGKIIM